MPKIYVQGETTTIKSRHVTMFEMMKVEELAKAEARLQMFKAKVRESMNALDMDSAKMWYLNLQDEEKYIDYLNKL